MLRVRVGTYDVVVLAAHSFGGASIAGGDADGGDGRALETDLGSDVLEDDAEEAQDGGTSSGVGLEDK